MLNAVSRVAVGRHWVYGFLVPNEADTCRRFVLPALDAAGWSDLQIREQVTFTDGRIVVMGGIPRRGRQKRADYILRYNRDFPIAVLEAKASYRNQADGLQQARSTPSYWA